MRFDRAKYSDCKHCPLRGNNVVRSICRIEEPKMALLGEAPGKDEDISGEPFTGAAGKLLSKILYAAEIRRGSLWVMNVIGCRPPNNKITTDVAQAAIKCCRPGLEKEMEYLRENGCKVVVGLGATAMEAMIGERGITKLRGFVSILSKKPQLLFVPTYHPAWILRGMWKETGTVVEDLKKAARLTKGRYRPPREVFQLEPTLEDLRKYEEKVRGKLIAVDIEATGLRTDRAQIVVVGLAEDSEHGMSVPFLKMGGLKYWNGKEEKEAFDLLRKILKNPTIFQNAAYDVPMLEYNGFPVPDTRHDTLIMHRDIHPELPHRLSYIVSLYGTTPYWKGTLLNRVGTILSIPDKELRKYNLRDVVVLHQVSKGMLKDLKSQRMSFIYKNISMKLLRPTIEMSMNGMPFSQERLKKWKGKLEAQVTRSENELKRLTGIPEGFSWDSAQHLDLLFHGKVGNMFLNAQATMEKYRENPKLRHDTKKYRENEKLAKVAKETKKLVLPTGFNQKKSGKTFSYSYNNDSMTVMKIETIKRLTEIAKFRRPRKIHEDEKKGLGVLLKVVDIFQMRQKLMKLSSTYTDFPVWKDGRVHASYKVFGTATGRLASGSLAEGAQKSKDSRVNAQNIPPEAKHLFLAKEGWEILEADYSNLELRVLAYMAGISHMIKAFENGENIHDNNTRMFLGITPEDKEWKQKRKIMKMYVFGRNYGGGLPGMYHRLMVAMPDMNMSYEEFCQLDAKYRDENLEYEVWRRNVLRELRENDPPVLRNAFGRIRVFMGTPDEVDREGLNFGIQSTAADIINQALIELYPWVTTRKKNVLLIGQVHDSLVFEVKRTYQRTLVKAVKKAMEQKFVINGKKVSFPVEISSGPSWAELHEV